MKTVYKILIVIGIVVMFLVGYLYLFISNIGDEKIEITTEYIKTGWMLKDTKNYRLSIQRIFSTEEIYIDSLNYEYLEKKNFVSDSCVTFFGKKSGDILGLNDEQIIYFNIPSRGWTWDKICDQKGKDKKVFKSTTFDLKKKSFYWILLSYRRYHNSYRIYLYVDDNNVVHSYYKKINSKDI